MVLKLDDHDSLSGMAKSGRSFERVRSKVDQRGGSGRFVQNWTVLSQTGWSFEPKWTVQDFWISGLSTFADRPV